MNTETVTEYGLLMSGGGFQIRWADPQIEEIYPTPKWLAAQVSTGGHVYRRRIIVVEEWEEVITTEALSHYPTKHEGEQQ